jgi:predicted transcriptional regulator
MDASVRDRAIAAFRQLPDDASVDEMLEILYFLAKVERGLQQIDTGRLVAHEDAKRRFVADLHHRKPTEP